MVFRNFGRVTGNWKFTLFFHGLTNAAFDPLSATLSPKSASFIWTSAALDRSLATFGENRLWTTSVEIDFFRIKKQTEDYCSQLSNQNFPLGIRSDTFFECKVKFVKLSSTTCETKFKLSFTVSHCIRPSVQFQE